LATGGQLGNSSTTILSGGDAGTTSTSEASNTGGCGCRVAGKPTNSNSMALLGAIGLLRLRSRKRKSM